MCNFVCDCDKIDQPSGIPWVCIRIIAERVRERETIISFWCWAIFPSEFTLFAITIIYTCYDSSFPLNLYRSLYHLDRVVSAMQSRHYSLGFLNTIGMRKDSSLSRIHYNYIQYVHACSNASANELFMPREIFRYQIESICFFLIIVVNKFSFSPSHTRSENEQ